MTQDEVLRTLENAGALLSGHFELRSGLHSDRYLQSALVLQQPDIATKLCAALAANFRDQRIEAVIAPALGGVFVSHETARALGTRALFAERVNGELTLRRGFSIKPGERLLVVEDVITTGKSTKETIAVVHCGVDAAVFTPEPDAPPRRPTVLFVGKLAENKGLGTVFRAVMSLRKRYPDILLRLAGKADDDAPRILMRDAAAAGAALNFELIGFVGREQLPGLYRTADVFCSPSQFECGVANTYIEAMACGIPLICSPWQDCEGLFRPGKDYLVACDAGEMTRRIEQVLTCEEDARSLARHGRDPIRSRHTCAHRVDELLAIYGRLSGRLLGEKASTRHPRRHR